MGPSWPTLSRLYNFPSSLADNIASSLLRDDKFTSSYIATNQHRLAESYFFVTSLLRRYGIPFYESNAAFFVWINLGAVTKDGANDTEIMARLREKKVYVGAGYMYASEKPGWFRMVFAHPTPILQEGLQRIAQALEI